MSRTQEQQNVANTSDYGSNHSKIHYRSNHNSDSHHRYSNDHYRGHFRHHSHYPDDFRDERPKKRLFYDNPKVIRRTMTIEQQPVIILMMVHITNMTTEATTEKVRAKVMDQIATKTVGLNITKNLHQNSLRRIPAKMSNQLL